MLHYRRERVICGHKGMLIPMPHHPHEPDVFVPLWAVTPPLGYNTAASNQAESAASRTTTNWSPPNPLPPFRELWPEMYELVHAIIPEMAEPKWMTMSFNFENGLVIPIALQDYQVWIPLWIIHGPNPDCLTLNGPFGQFPTGPCKGANCIGCGGDLIYIQWEMPLRPTSMPHTPPWRSSNLHSFVSSISPQQLSILSTPPASSSPVETSWSSSPPQSLLAQSLLASDNNSDVTFDLYGIACLVCGQYDDIHTPTCPFSLYTPCCMCGKYEDHTNDCAFRFGRNGYYQVIFLPCHRVSPQGALDKAEREQLFAKVGRKKENGHEN